MTTTSLRSEFAAKIEALTASSSVRRLQGVKGSHFVAESFARIFSGIYLHKSEPYAEHYPLDLIEAWPEAVFQEFVALKWVPRKPCHPLEALAKMDDDAPAS